MESGGPCSIIAYKALNTSNTSANSVTFGRMGEKILQVAHLNITIVRCAS